MDFKNIYWLLRHGRSLANEAGVIVSSKAEGIKEEWKLAPAGRDQAVAAGKQLQEQLAHETGAKLAVVTSPFSRAVETAKLAAQQCGVGPDSGPEAWQVADELVERSFGAAHELTHADTWYEETWRHDVQDAHYRPGGDGESVDMVAGRIQALFQRLEQQYSEGGWNILLVAHGDTLSICQAAMTPGADIKHHREYAFQTAELKRLRG